MVSQIQFTQPQAYSGGVDFSPLERLGYALAAKQQEAQQSEEAYRLMGGGQGQDQQQGGFFQDLGRRFGLIPEQAPGAPPARATAAVPTSPQVADGSGIGTMTPNARKWFDYAIRPVDQGGLGLSQAQAAGKVANLQAESTPDIKPWGETGDKGTAFYAAQWRGPRLNNLHAFAAAKGLDPRQTETQQAFMRHEYLGNDPQVGNQFGGGSEGKAYAELTATNNPRSAAAAVDQFYERSSGATRGKRMAGAERMARGLPGAPVVAQDSGPNASFQATPRLPAGLSPPPDPNASPLDTAPWPQGNVGAPPPGAVAAGAPAPPLQTAAVPAAPVVASDVPEAKVAQNLVSGQPAAAAGVNREQLAQMYRNPLTRPLATAILQKQMEPGKYSWQQVGTNLIRTNDKTGEQVITMRDTKPLIVGGSLATEDPSKPGGYAFHTPPSSTAIHVKPGETVVIPDGTGGQKTISGGSQAALDIENNTYKADVLKLEGRKREFMIANGKLPSSDDIPAGDRRRIDKLSDAVNAADSAITTLGEMETLNQQAFKGWGASFKAAAAANLIPNTEWGKRGQATLELNNEMTRSALNQLKAVFTGSQSKEELAVLRTIQGAIDNPGTMNANIFKRARDVLELKRQRSEAEQESIASGERYKPGGIRTAPAPAAAAPATEAPATTGAKPSLSDFMVKARVANPGVSEGELARYWKDKYGGK